MGGSLLRQGYGGQADSCAPLALPSWGWKSLSRWRYISSIGAGARRPKFKAPLSAEWSSVRFSSHMPRSKVDPGGIMSPRLLDGPSDAGLLRAAPRRSPLRGSPAGRLARSARFSITLMNLLPHVAFTGLYQPSSVCETPCGLCDFVPSGPAGWLRIFRRRYRARGSLCTLQSCCFPIHRPSSWPPGACC